jgi:hypothetical protein
MQAPSPNAIPSTMPPQLAGDPFPIISINPPGAL